jgi:hypothetical protein
MKVLTNFVNVILDGSITFKVIDYREKAPPPIIVLNNITITEKYDN